MSKYILLLCAFCFTIHADAGHGHSEVEQEKILICGVCKDIDFAVGNTIRNIEKLGKRFSDYAVIIYENNSTDMTPQLYADWARRNSHVVFVSENLAAHELPGSREERIARARNIVLDIARDEKYDDFTHLIMVDLDFTHAWPISEIVETVQMQGDWHCISANGVKRSGSYWDRYAFRDAKFPFGPELLGHDWWNQLFKTWFEIKGDNPRPVYSAFGGLAVYKRSAIIPFGYSGTVTEDLQNYYGLILPKLLPNNPHLLNYLRINRLGYDDQLFLKPVIFECSPPSDQYEFYRRLVCCEHVTLHASMALNGFGNFFINPKLVMKY